MNLCFQWKLSSESFWIFFAERYDNILSFRERGESNTEEEREFIFQRQGSFLEARLHT